MSNTKWVSFRDREGPVVHGVHEYQIPSAPTERDIYVAAAVACEHGSYDDVNMYDRGIVSIGLFQWIEANYGSVSTLLGLVCEAGLGNHVQECLEPALRATGSKFAKGPVRWQFVHNGVIVDSLEAQRKLFLGGEGKTGTWTPEARGRAILWAECLASVWDDPGAREIQRKFANDRVTQYVFKTAKATLFHTDAPKTPLANATRAIYIAMAVNAPGTADSILLETLRVNPRLKEWSDEWCLAILRSLATTKLLPNFAKRYANSRAVVEKACGVKLPANFTDVVVQKAVSVTEAPGQVARRQRSVPPQVKIIQLEPIDIVVPVPKKSFVSKILSIFKRR